MSLLSGEKYIKAFFLNPDQKKVVHEKHGWGRPPPCPVEG
jgi:hypothetical protein